VQLSLTQENGHHSLATEAEESCQYTQRTSASSDI